MTVTPTLHLACPLRPGATLIFTVDMVEIIKPRTGAAAHLDEEGGQFGGDYEMPYGEDERLVDYKVVKPGDPDF